MHWLICIIWDVISNVFLICLQITQKHLQLTLNIHIKGAYCLSKSISFQYQDSLNSIDYRLLVPSPTNIFNSTFCHFVLFYILTSSVLWFMSDVSMGTSPVGGCSFSLFSWQSSTFDAEGAVAVGGLLCSSKARNLSRFSVSYCLSTIFWKVSSSTAGLQCFLSSSWNNSEDSTNFLFFVSNFSSICCSSAWSFFWCMANDWTWRFKTCIRWVVTTLRTSGTIASEKISLIKRWLRKYREYAICLNENPSSWSSSSSAGCISIRRSCWFFELDRGWSWTSESLRIKKY